jgi:hypothetical protein
MRQDLEKVLQRPRKVEFMSRAEVVLSDARRVSARAKAALRALIKDDFNIIEPRSRENRPPDRSH